MAVLANRARVQTSTAGTGTLTLGSAIAGYATLAEAGVSDADEVSYVLEDGNDFEIGTGTYTASGTTLSRDTVTLSKISGTAGTAKINLSGSATVFLTARAEDLPTLNANGGIDLSTTAGIDVNPGSDVDADLFTVGVTGTVTFSWDESADAFRMSKPLVVDASGNGDVTHTIAGTSVISQIELHSEGAGQLGGLTIHRHTDNNNFGGHLLFLRSDGDHATPTLVDDGDTLGRMIGTGYDGADYEMAGEIRFVVDGTAASNDMPGALDFYTNAGSQVLTRRVRMRADGSVEIVAGPLVPSANDGAALGTTSLSWSDLVLASGAVLNFANGDVTITHSSNLLTFGGGVSLAGAVNFSQTGYTDIAEISTPANPAVNIARLYAFDDTGTTKLAFRDSAGAETVLGEGGGGSSLPTGYISPSLILSNAADADHDLTIAAGSARSDDDTVDITLSSAITKAFDATWAVGDTNGGMQSGSSLPTSGTVNIYMIRRSDTGVVDVIGVPQGTSLSLPANYDSSAHIASICTDSSANFHAFSAFRRAGRGYYLNYSGLIADVHVEDQGTTAVSRTISVPVGRKILTHFHIDYQSAYCRVYDPDTPEVTPAADSLVLTTETATGVVSAGIDVWVWTNSSAQVDTDGSTSGRFFKCKTYGYFDPMV